MVFENISKLGRQGFTKNKKIGMTSRDLVRRMKSFGIEGSCAIHSLFTTKECDYLLKFCQDSDTYVTFFCFRKSRIKSVIYYLSSMLFIESKEAV